MATKVDFLRSVKREVNQAHIVSLTDNSGGSGTDALAAIGVTDLTDESAGSAGATLAAIGVTNLTNNSGGSATSTLNAITGGGGPCETATKDAVASLAAHTENINVELGIIEDSVSSLAAQDAAIADELDVIEDSVASLAAKIEELIVLLENAGITATS